MPLRRSQSTTLAALARELGVSRTTVSNAYNHPEQLSAELRKKILAAARRRGYPGPNPAARSLRTRRTGAIGVVLTEDLGYAFDDLASVDFLAGVAEAGHGTRTSLNLLPLGADGSAGGELIAGASVDGFIVYSVAAEDPALNAALGRGLPTVVVGQPGSLPKARRGRAPAGFVGIEDRPAIRPAVRELTRAGHRRIGVLAIRLFRERSQEGPVAAAAVGGADFHIQRDRVLGVLDECLAAGVDPNSVPVVSRHINDPANARSAAAELLDSNPGLTAVACTTDTMALGVLDECAARGWAVPERLSVTGFDGIRPALERGLTTVVQPNRAKGVAAAEMLAGLVANGREDGAASPPEGRGGFARAELLETSLHPGGSVAAPR
ncbi:LacI family DNA-binding transcriptional regulator [Corynebacterium otitidis]|uniref:LacI family DNA-binding transcriptional regulator n=1 Tax=Corynebacterium otitidis TaxID=29321 RepID=UPI0006280DC1|nr:LacI family DNA-binding transcriptional regulator [Corynebacterium otitidis]KKO84252.1 LacI family transcriptional regulator [Corynebacterium otitidis]